MLNVRVTERLLCEKINKSRTWCFLFRPVSPCNYDAKNGHWKQHLKAGSIPNRGTHKLAHVNILLTCTSKAGGYRPYWTFIIKWALLNIRVLEGCLWRFEKLVPRRPLEMNDFCLFCLRLCLPLLLSLYVFLSIHLPPSPLSLSPSLPTTPTPSFYSIFLFALI